MMEKIYDLAFEIDGDSISLEQDAGCGEVDRVTLHAIHVRMLAEKTGLLPPAPPVNVDADRTIARLQRQLLVLHSRIDHLDDMIRAAAAKGHEDLELESCYAYATWELAREFVEGLTDADAPATADETPETSQQRHGDVTHVSRVTAQTVANMPVPFEVAPAHQRSLLEGTAAPAGAQEH
jgi:hypothetical protein